MKKKEPEQTPIEGEKMRQEYDFEQMVGETRGAYYKRYREGHTVMVHHEDGSRSVQHFTLEDGAVLLEPDVREYFPDSDAVNKALRALIELIPERERAGSKETSRRPWHG